MIVRQCLLLLLSLLLLLLLLLMACESLKIENDEKLTSQLLMEQAAHSGRERSKAKDSNEASDAESRLQHMLFDHSGYNNLIRPVTSLNDTVHVDFGLALVQLINVEEKSQVLITNVWLRMKWYDYQLRWDPDDFEGVRIVRAKAEKVWKPDIVLYNNADGHYEVSWQPNVLIFHTGAVMWIPPAIYHSSCSIHVEFFPFDQQTCEMKFGSWTYDATQVRLGWYEGATSADLSDYWRSGSWDLIECPAKIANITRSGQPDQIMMIFTLTIQRKALFYTVNLIIPCLLISLLSVCVFYLPADAGEKVTLCISILTALVFFLLLVSKILPATSLSIPLISKFLLFTFVMNTVAIVSAVCIINCNFRSNRTHKMSQRWKQAFLCRIPRLLKMRRPRHVTEAEEKRWRIKEAAEGWAGDCNGARQQQQQQQMQRQRSQSCWNNVGLSQQARAAVAAINFVASHLRERDEGEEVEQSWKYVAWVVDRLQLFLFIAVTAAGTANILLSAPYIFKQVDQEEILARLRSGG